LKCAYTASMFDLEENLSDEEVLLRFKEVFGRDMTPGEMPFFLSPASKPDKPSYIKPTDHEG
jgi:hypothetical protein